MIPGSIPTVLIGSGGGLAASQAKALLHLDGAHGSTDFTDQYGNTWTATDGSIISNAYSKFASTSLSNLAAATAIISCAALTPNSAAWTVETFIRWSPLFDAATRGLFSLINGSGYGYKLGMSRSGSTLTYRQALSSNGTSWNVAINDYVAGGTVAADTWYHIASTYDPTAGAYYLYMDGIAISTYVSASQMCATTQMGTGSNWTVFVGCQGYESELRLSNVCRYPGGTSFTPPSSPFTE